MLNSYAETVAFLYAQLPEFQRTGAPAYKPGLENTCKLLEHLGNPHLRFKSIHVAGTNGKGSTSHSLAAVFQAAGYKTGLYTSPHLVDFRERIRINGQMIPEKRVIERVTDWLPMIDEIKPSFFELTVALAFDHFASEKVDIAIVEVGMGGRLDSTNVIVPELSVITNISLDHQQFLGESLPKIAAEKAGIIKPGKPVVLSEHQHETDFVFEEKAKAENAELYHATENFTIQDLDIENGYRKIVAANRHSGTRNPYLLSLLGSYQLKNVAGILESIYQMQELGWQINDEAIKLGLANVQKMTGLQGRWQILQTSPLTICDTGHNEAGIAETVRQLQTCAYEKLWLVWGMVKDKDPDKIVRLLPTDAEVIATQASIARALPATELADKLKEAGLRPVVKENVEEALAFALKHCGANDLIFIGGSTFVVAEIPFEKFSQPD